MLGSLPQHLHLSLYLDNIEAPDTRVVRGLHHGHEEDLVHKFQETLDRAADAVARGLAGTPTVMETFALLIPENFDIASVWREYHVVPGEEPARAMRCLPGVCIAGGAQWCSFAEMTLRGMTVRLCRLTASPHLHPIDVAPRCLVYMLLTTQTHDVHSCLPYVDRSPNRAFRGKCYILYQDISEKNKQRRLSDAHRKTHRTGRPLPALDAIRHPF